MNKLLGFIGTLLRPNCWLRIEPFDRAWDRVVNEMLDRGDKIVVGSSYTTQVGKHTVWTRNYPYAYGAKQTGICTSASGLPSRTTVRRLKKAIDKARIEDWTSK